MLLLIHVCNFIYKWNNNVYRIKGDDASKLISATVVHPELESGPFYGQNVATKMYSELKFQISSAKGSK